MVAGTVHLPNPSAKAEGLSVDALLVYAEEGAVEVDYLTFRSFYVKNIGPASAG